MISWAQVPAKAVVASARGGRMIPGGKAWRRVDWLECLDCDEPIEALSRTDCPRGSVQVGDSARCRCGWRGETDIVFDGEGHPRGTVQDLPRTWARVSLLSQYGTVLPVNPEADALIEDLIAEQESGESHEIE